MYSGKQTFEEGGKGKCVIGVIDFILLRGVSSVDQSTLIMLTEEFTVVICSLSHRAVFICVPIARM